MSDSKFNLIGLNNERFTLDFHPKDLITLSFHPLNFKNKMIYYYCQVNTTNDFIEHYIKFQIEHQSLLGQLDPYFKYFTVEVNKINHFYLNLNYVFLFTKNKADNNTEAHYIRHDHIVSYPIDKSVSLNDLSGFIKFEDEENLYFIHIENFKKLKAYSYSYRSPKSKLFKDFIKYQIILMDL